MYQVARCDIDKLLELTAYQKSIFTTYEWICFLKRNQRAEPVLLEMSENDKPVIYFVGLIIKKIGVKILGSPFDGWLSPDMGFIRLKQVDINDVLQTVKDYAFRELKCLFVQIIDKSIRIDDINSNIKYGISRVLYIDNSLEPEAILEHFTKNGRRDVRASGRKGLIFEKVDFNREFVETYYDQLVDVFAKQNLKPFYGLNKMYDLVDAFKDRPERVLALKARLDNKCVATLFSFGYGEWAYYMGAASYREYQKYLPNEGLFWEFIKYWNSKKISNIDMVGYREYKMKYNPKIFEIPIIEFQKFPFLLELKRCAKSVVVFGRKLKGLISK